MPRVIDRPVEIEYEVRGEDRNGTVLLVMGLGAQMIVWPESFVDDLVADGFRVIRFDNRDVGRSTFLDAPAPKVPDLLKALASPRRAAAHAAYALQDMAGDAIAVLDAVGVDRVHVVGASMGGMIAQEIAIGHPERVLSLCSIMSTTGRRGVGTPSPKLMATMVKARSGERARTLDELVAFNALIAGPHFDPAVNRDLVERQLAREPDPAKVPQGLARQTFAILSTRDRTPHLQRLTVPTLVIHGLADQLVRPSGGLATARAVPGARLLMFPDMAHDVPSPRTGEVHEAIVTNIGRAEVAVGA